MKLLRKQVLEFIEPLRANKELGSSLEAEAIITTPLDTVLEMKEEMADICIISQIEFKKGDPAIVIREAEGEKCVRCWKVLPEVAESADHLCSRCTDVVTHKKAA